MVILRIIVRIIDHEIAVVQIRGENERILHDPEGHRH